MHALSNVVYSSNRADGLACIVVKRLALRVYIFYAPVLHQKTIRDIVGSFVPDRIGISPADQVAIIRMDRINEGFERAVKMFWIDFEYTRGFVRPRKRVAGNVEFPA